MINNPTINFGNVKVSAFDYAVSGNMILGTRSAGKTTTFKFLAESLMDLGIPLLIIDPVGKSRYLKKSNPNNPNGKGYPIIIVGQNGDIPLSLDTIEDVVRTALKTRSSLVIDLYDTDILESWDEIVEKIARVLLYENENDAKGIHNGLRHLILEEASEFIHQENKKTGSSVWIERLIRMSGNCKVGVTVVNQDTETISKKVLKLCRNRIIGCQTEYNSINNIRKWMNRSGMLNAEEVSESLPSLQSGEFYVWSKENNTLIKTTIPQIKSLHPSRNEMTELDTTESDDIDSVIEQMKTMQPTESLHLFSMSDYIPVIVVAKEETISVALDVAGLSWTDRSIVQQAEQTPYGSKNVKAYVDSIVSHGYLTFIPMGNGGYLQDTSGKIVSLNSALECKYATLLLANL